MHKVKVEHSFPFLRTICITMFCVFLLIIGISLVDYYYTKQTIKHHERVTYTQFLKQVNELNVERVVIEDNNMIGKLKNGQVISTDIPISSEFIDALKKNNVQYHF
jgi:ATP-dependent Zn protease